MMKLSYYRLAEHLDQGKLLPVYVVVGEQDLLRELAVAEIKRHVLGEAETPFNLDRFDGEATDGAHVVMSANLLPMLGGQRLVIVKRAQKLLEKSEELRAYLDDPSPQTILLLELSKSPDKRRKAWKEVEQKASIIACATPKTAELLDWVSEQARERKLRLGHDAVSYLVSESGGDLRHLLNELEKLSLYAGEEKLDLETIATVLGRGKAQSIFRFLDALAAGDSKNALRQLGRLLEEGEPPLRILALVDRLVGQLRMAKEFQSSPRRGDSLAKVLGVPPFAAKGIAEAARRFDRTMLERALRSLADADRVLKSSGLPARLFLESLAISLCAGGGRRVSSERGLRTGG